MSCSRNLNFIKIYSWIIIKFVYFEKATKFCKFSTVDLTVTTLDKSKVNISQKILAFLEYMNFTLSLLKYHFVLFQQFWVTLPANRHGYVPMAAYVQPPWARHITKLVEISPKPFRHSAGNFKGHMEYAFEL